MKLYIIFKSAYTVVTLTLLKVNLHLPGISVIIHMIRLIISFPGTFKYLDGNPLIFT
jgi:hypothetical protein